MSRWDEMWQHLRWLYERAGREYTEEAARWYEANEPLELAGIALKVQTAIERREAADAAR